MPSTLIDIGISERTAEALRAAKLAAWKVMLQDWRDVGPHTIPKASWEEEFGAFHQKVVLSPTHDRCS